MDKPEFVRAALEGMKAALAIAEDPESAGHVVRRATDLCVGRSSTSTAAKRLLQQVADQLTLLLAESDDPAADMATVEEMLLEAGLWEGTFQHRPTPAQFGRVVIADNPWLAERMSTIERVFVPEESETPEDLISNLL